MAKKRTTTKNVQHNESRPFVPQVEVHAEIDGGPFDNDGLSVRQRSFVEALVGPAGGNQSKAAEMAGYAAENRIALAVTASRLLNNANVQEAIGHALAKRRATPEWATNQLIYMASGSMAKFIEVDEQGEPRVDWKKAAAAAAIGQIKEYEERPTDGGAPIRKIKLHDSKGALALLLKFHNLISGDSEPPGETRVRVRRVNRGKPNE